MTKVTPRGALLLALALASALPNITFAQEASSSTAPPLTEEQRAELGRLYDEAEAHERAGRYALAFQAFMRLHGELERIGSPRASVPLFGAGSALSNVPGREREARDVLQRFLDGSTPLIDNAEIADYRSRAAASITELDARIGSNHSGGSTSVSSDAAPPTAEVGSTSAAGENVSPVGPIVLGVGVAGLGIGAVLGTLALVNDGALSTRCGGPSCLDTVENHSTYDEMWSLAAASDITLVVGGLAAATGLILIFVLHEGSPEATAAQARLVVRPGQLAITGTF